MSDTELRRPNPPSILKLDSTPFRSPILPFAGCSRRALSDRDSPHVHFPPTPELKEMFPADSYDREPIVVSPNVVQLPRRGARKLRSPPPEPRGRTRVRQGCDGVEDSDIKGSYFHPRAYEACTLEPTIRSSPSEPLPPLIQDLSPSDESDDSICTPPRAMRLAVRPSSIAHTISLNMPNFSKLGNLPKYGLINGAEGRPLLSSSSPPPSENPAALRPDESGKRPSRAFYAAMDEGCLGGF